MPCSTDSQHVAQLSQTPHGEVIYIRCYPGGINPQKPKTDPPEPDRTPMGDLITKTISEWIRSARHVSRVFHWRCLQTQLCFIEAMLMPPHHRSATFHWCKDGRLRNDHFYLQENEKIPQLWQHPNRPTMTTKSWKLTCHQSHGRITGSLLFWKCN